MSHMSLQKCRKILKIIVQIQHILLATSHGSGTISRKYRRKNNGADLSGPLTLGLFLAVYYVFKYWQWTLVLVVILAMIVLAYYLRSKKRSRAKSASSAPYAFDHNATFQTDKDEEVSKGDEFERYVVNLLDERYFTIVEWTTDIMRKHHRYVEADTRPDLLVRYDPTGEEFYVECKYRSYLYEHKFQWSTHEQMNRYLRFAYEKKLPFFVVMGLGGTPNRPEKMYCVPLQEVRYPHLYPKGMINFYHEPGKNLFWDGYKLY